MDSYAIRIASEDGTRGPFDTVEQVREALRVYIEEEQGDLSRVSLWKMTEGGSAGEPLPLDQFLP